MVGVLKGGDGGIFVVSERFDVCFGRFRGIGGCLEGGVRA